MEIVTKCAHCGAQIHFENGTEILKCEYCDSLNVIESKPIEKSKNINTGGVTDNNVGILDKEYNTRELTKPKLTFAANFFTGGDNSQGGHLWITDYEVYFQPHKFNFGDLSKKYIKIKDIIGYEKGFLTMFTIKTLSKDMKLAVWKKQAIIDAIEEKRRKLALEP